jgi:hypothetical protein
MYLPTTYHLSRRAGLTAATVRQEDFPLPGLAGRLAGWVRELSAGRAFVLIRGFPLDLLSEAETELAYVGLGLHLGTPVSQNAAGDLLGHVRDTGVARDSPAVRLYATNERQDFHCDGSDLVGLLCLKTAKAGGESKIVSSMAVYNEMLARRPDLVEVLRQPFAWDRNDEQSPGEDPFFSLPVIFDIGGAPRIFFVGWYIRDAQRHPQAPRLTEQQLEALELLEGIANDPSFYLQMKFSRGHPAAQQRQDPARPRGLHRPRRPGRAPSPAAAVADRARLRQRRGHPPERHPRPPAGRLAGRGRQHGGHPLQRGRHEAVVDPGPAPLAVDEPGLAQHFQVVADGGLGQVERAGEVAHADLTPGPGADQGHQPEPDRVAERLEHLRQPSR